MKKVVAKGSTKRPMIFLLAGVTLLVTGTLFLLWMYGVFPDRYSNWVRNLFHELGLFTVLLLLIFYTLGYASPWIGLALLINGILLLLYGSIKVNDFGVFCGRKFVKFRDIAYVRLMRTGKRQSVYIRQKSGKFYSWKYIFEPKRAVKALNLYLEYLGGTSSV